MEKIKVDKQVLETKQVIVFKSFDGKEFETEKDCLNYEKSKFDKIEFEKEYKISKIENVYIEEDILAILQYSLATIGGSIYKITIPNNYWNQEFDSKEFEKHFKLYFEIKDKNFIITDIGELFFIRVYSWETNETTYQFISRESLINEFNKRIETIKNL
jgi:hypothetical protein